MYRRVDKTDYLDGAITTIDVFRLLSSPVLFSNDEKKQILFAIIDDIFFSILDYRNVVYELLRLKKTFAFYKRDLALKNCALIADLIRCFREDRIDIEDIKLAVDRRWGNV